MDEEAGTEAQMKMAATTSPAADASRDHSVVVLNIALADTLSGQNGPFRTFSKTVSLAEEGMNNTTVAEFMRDFVFEVCHIWALKMVRTHSSTQKRYKNSLLLCFGAGFGVLVCLEGSGIPTDWKKVPKINVWTSFHPSEHTTKVCSPYCPIWDYLQARGQDTSFKFHATLAVKLKQQNFHRPVIEDRIKVLCFQTSSKDRTIVLQRRAIPYLPSEIEPWSKQSRRTKPRKTQTNKSAEQDEAETADKVDTEEAEGSEDSSQEEEEDVAEAATVETPKKRGRPKGPKTAAAKKKQPPRAEVEEMTSEEEEATKPKATTPKKRGRPKGSKNKPKNADQSVSSKNPKTAPRAGGAKSGMNEDTEAASTPKRKRGRSKGQKSKSKE